MTVNLRQSLLLLTIFTLNPKRVYDFPDNTRCPSYSNVFMTHGTVLIEDQPILNASLAKQLVAVVTLLCVSCHLETNLAEEVACKIFWNCEISNGISIVAS